MLFSDLAADIATPRYKTEPTAPHQIGGVRLSKNKGAHKPQTTIIVVTRVVSSRKCWVVGQPRNGLVDSGMSRRMRIS